uniref:PA2c domain-containing protein n=1 Tax=Panagrellus redivivus TaxID=6233 RepID=A0A7E4VV78_PANRE
MRPWYSCSAFLAVISTFLELPTPVGAYHCGTGAISTTLSWITTAGCDGEKLSNECCFPHDRCIDVADEVYNSTFYGQHNRVVHRSMLMKCDTEFRQCIRSNYSDRDICRTWLEVTHATVVTLYTKFKNLFE